MAINRFVVVALIFVGMVAYVSAADTPAGGAGDAAGDAGGGAIGGGPAGSPDAAGGPDAAAGGAGGATSAAAPAEGNAPSFKTSGIYAVVAAVVVVGCFF